MDSKFKFNKLDKQTRLLMCEEITIAEKSKNVYESTRFNDTGRKIWVTLLQNAAQEYDEHWLAYQLEIAGAMKDLETKAKPKGGYTIAHVPDKATETLADGQFNRFYMAAICRRALNNGKLNVIIYRAKERIEPRPGSQLLEGTSRDANTLLQELRIRDLSLKCNLLKPNSGLSIDY
jgi:isocitrate dehydrogenase kinase/phosphatase